MNDFATRLSSTTKLFPEMLNPESSTSDWMDTIRLVACDMDGTLTLQGKFCDRLLSLLQRLEAAKIPTFIVTGRSAGWVSGLVEYLPIAGAIAENGGIFFSADYPQGLPLVELAPMGEDNRNSVPQSAITTPYHQHRQQLSELFVGMQSQWPQLVPSADNPYRLTDWTFDKNDLPDDVLGEMTQYCLDRGWGFTYSSIQCHLKRIEQSKQAGLLQVISLGMETPLSGSDMLTFGDSPNDETLFDVSVFPYSVGVLNLKPYLSTLKHQPRWLASQAEFLGVSEVLNLLLENGN